MCGPKPGGSSPVVCSGSTTEAHPICRGVSTTRARRSSEATPSMPEFARHLADDRPEEIALRDSRRTMTWSGVGDVLDRVANRLLATDLGRKRRVAVFAENANETALAHLGGLLGGASTVPVNFHLTAAEAAYILDDSESRIVFVGPETVERAIEAVESMPTTSSRPVIVAWRCCGATGVDDWVAWLAGGRPGAPPTHIEPLPNMLYTSGTTGTPKGTELPPTMFMGGATMVEHIEALQASRYAAFG